MGLEREQQEFRCEFQLVIPRPFVVHRLGCGSLNPPRNNNLMSKKRSPQGDFEVSRTTTCVNYPLCFYNEEFVSVGE